MNRLSAYGAAFCDELNIALAELANVLQQADAVGLSNDPAVVSGHAIYDDRSSFSVYVGVLGDACKKDTAEVSTAAEKVRALIKARSGMDIAPLRPDYQPRTPATPLASLLPEDLPLWAKIGGALALGTLGLLALAYITGQSAGVIKLFKRAKMSGYKRRRRR